MTPSIEPELVERMVALVSAMQKDGSHVGPGTHGSLVAAHYNEARKIAALINPVDPALQRAREIAASVANEGGNAPTWPDEIIAGRYDTHPVVRAAQEALKVAQAQQ